MLLGVIADTHGMVHPRIAEVFAGVDAILHAGDVGTDKVLSLLKQIAPVMAVRGNMDCPPFSYDLPAFRVSRVHDQTILITHRVGNPAKPSPRLQERLQQVRPTVVVFGHTHHPYNERINGILFFNPGSGGQRRHGHPLSVGFLEIHRSGMAGRILSLE